MFFLVNLNILAGRASFWTRQASFHRSEGVLHRSAQEHALHPVEGRPASEHLWVNDWQGNAGCCCSARQRDRQRAFTPRSRCSKGQEGLQVERFLEQIEQLRPMLSGQMHPGCVLWPQWSHMPRASFQHPPNPPSSSHLVLCFTHFCLALPWEC